MKEESKPDKDFKYLVRIANTDLDGNKQVYQALRKIKGISFMYANAICEISGVNKTQKIGTLKDSDVKKLDEAIKNTESIPSWLYNRKKDVATGKNKHLIGVDLSFTQESDIQTMKKIRSYRGIRHMFGLPVRGQKTKANFRSKKGKVMGVQKRKGAKAGRS